MLTQVLTQPIGHTNITTAYGYSPANYDTTTTDSPDTHGEDALGYALTPLLSTNNTTTHGRSQANHHRFTRIRRDTHGDTTKFTNTLSCPTKHSTSPAQ